MSESTDADLLLKKRARRRLLGAVAFAGLAAVVLPMVMDDEPKQQVQDVQIRIPGQDQTPFAPKLNRTARPEAAEESAKAAEKAAEKPTEKTSDKPVEKALPKAADKPVEKPADKPAVKTAEKAAAEKPQEKASPEAKIVERSPVEEAQRAAAILAGKHVDTVVGGNGQFVVLIGAFANPANVKQLQSKLGELGIKVMTESIDSSAGKKTRVRAGPFASRDAAEKAAEKMKRIGVNGVVAARP